MLGCHSCGRIGSGPLCGSCHRELAPGGTVWLDHGLVGRAALCHAGAARRMVHRLKYDGDVGAAEIMARLMAELVPAASTALVPVPRATVRRMRFGVDPALVLARLISGRCGLPVVDALDPGLWWPRRAGALHRAVPKLLPRAAAPDGAVLVDDVLTTGATLVTAFRTLHLRHAVGLTATAPATMGLQTSRRRAGAGEVA